MSALKSNDNVSRVKESNNIVDLIGEYVDLKRAGKNYKGLCPFHREKTPSFIVSEENQSFKCFGCGKGGDILTFVMERDGMEFPEALNFLADRAGITLDNNIGSRRAKINKEKYYQLNEEVSRYFFENLLTSKFPRDYLRMREISAESINTFRLGYANDSWDSLLNFLLKNKVKLEDAEALGLIAKSKNGNYYDVFRNRLIFPIIDIRGRTVGFGGRALGEDRAKYINSPETPVFHKGDQLYGLNLVHKSNFRDKVILVEGYMDVIGLNQEGIGYSLAGLGTALTPNQARTVSRYGERIYISYDSDDAGLKATEKAIEVFSEQKKHAQIVELDRGMDPDEYIKKHGQEAFEVKLKEAIGPIDFLINQSLRDKDLSDPLVIESTIPALRKIINSIQSQVVRDAYIEKTAERLGVRKDSFRMDINLSQSERVPRRRTPKRKSKDLPELVSDILAISCRSEDYFKEFQNYLQVLEYYENGRILEDLKLYYNEEISFEQLKDSLPENIRSYVERVLAMSKDDCTTRYDEIKRRLNLIELKKEKQSLEEEISMMTSLIGTDREESVRADLIDKMTRYQELQKILKA